MKSIKLSDYFEIMKPTYVYLRLVPDTSIRNYCSASIIKSIHHMYKKINQRIHREQKKFIFETAVKSSYLIDIYKDSVDFLLIVPQPYLSIVREKIREVYPKITIEERAGVTPFSPDSLKYELVYGKEDGLSLALDKKNNYPLNDILNVIDIMQEKDRVSIIYNFMPWNQQGWIKNHDTTMQKIKHKQPIDREKFSGNYLIKAGFLFVVEMLDLLVDALFELTGSERKKGNSELSLLDLAVSTLNYEKDLDVATKKKRNEIILNTQMMVVSDSQDKNRKQNNAIAVCQAYKSVEGDNELIYKRVSSKVKVNIEDYNLPIETCKVSIPECQNFLQLPGRELLLQHKIIEKIDVLESPVPEELSKGVMCLGDVTFKGNTVRAYISTDKNFRFLTLCLIGPTRAGKTTLISNLSKDSIDNMECTILFDFCGNAELSDDVSKVIPKGKVLNIDCSNFETLQGLGYNEVSPLNDSVFEVYRAAKTKTSQLMTLVNALNDDEEFRARMERVLEAAAVVVFIQNGSIKQVFEILQDHKLRHKFIDNCPVDQSENLEEYIATLEEMDEWTKETKDKPAEIIGTKVSYSQGILSRVQKLKQNAYMEAMLKKSCENNIDLSEEMQKSQLICIRMPEVMFSTEQEKDIYCTYWLTKIWGALQKRKWKLPEMDDRVKVNIVFDELYQVPNCQDFLRSKLSQIAKFSCKPIISCHYLGQISNIRNELKAANSSYMLISGCDKDNFRELKEELEPYELEDLLNLKRFHSLNLIKYEGGWSKFITKLPPPVK